MLKALRKLQNEGRKEDFDKVVSIFAKERTTFDFWEHIPLFVDAEKATIYMEKHILLMKKKAELLDNIHDTSEESRTDGPV